MCSREKRTRRNLLFSKRLLFHRITQTLQHGDSTFLMRNERVFSSNSSTYHFKVSSLDVPSIWSPPSTAVSFGNGDIHDRVTIPPGESVTYTATGTLREEPVANLLSSCSNQCRGPTIMN